MISGLVSAGLGCYALDYVGARGFCYAFGAESDSVLALRGFLFTNKLVAGAGDVADEPKIGAVL